MDPVLTDLFVNIAGGLITYVIEKLDPAESLKVWLKRDPASLAFQKALARTYSAFARQFPEYTSSLFDQHFLGTEALPELSKLLTRSQHPDPALLAQAWGQSINADAEFAQAATKPASYFIERLESELKAEPALQALFDSRALESLPKLEVDIQKLVGDLQRGLDTALKSANNYQQAAIHVGGDVKGDGIIIGNNNQLTINKYYYSGNFVSLNEYYIPPDGVFQRVRVDEFVGRDWLTAKVDAFLNDPQRKSGAFLLIGDAGVGKTSFMAHLVKERRYLHLFAEQAPGQAMLQRAMQSLGSQLVTRYQIDPYKDRDTLNALSVFPDFLERILRLAASTLTEGEKIVIVCDALDEAGTFPDHFVFGLPKELPDGVYFILSQRPVNVKLPNFEPVIEKLEAQGEGNLQDIQAYLSAVAKRPEVAGQIRSKEYSEDFFIQTLKEKSQGVWMYLHYIIKEIESGARAPLDLANLPTGLVGYYAEYWDAWRTGKRGKGEEAWDELYAPLLTTLAAAQEAITVKTLIQWAGVTVTPREAIRLLSETWRAFITEKEVDGKKAYAPYHLSFKDFITGRADTDKLPPTQANLVKDLADQTVDAHQRIVNAFEKACNGEWEKLVEQDYPRLHLTAQLNGAEEYEKLRILLTEGDEKIKWADAKEKKEETYAGYLNDLTYVWDYAEREQNYALAIRCMLIENSIHSLAENIPPMLLSELARTGRWSYAKCLSIIQQKSTPQDQVISLIHLSKSMPRFLTQEVFLIISNIENEQIRANALATIAPSLGEELIIQAFLASQDINSENARAYILRNLLPLLQGEYQKCAIEELLSTANNFTDKTIQAEYLTFLLPYVNSSLKTQLIRSAFATASELIASPSMGGNPGYPILKALIPHLPESLKRQTISLAHKFEDEEERIVALAILSSYLDKDIKEQVQLSLISVARQIKGEGGRVHALTLISPYLEELKAQIIQEAISIAYKIKEVSIRAYAFELLLPHINDDIKKQIMEGLLLAARQIEDKQHRARIFTRLAPYLFTELTNLELQEILETKYYNNSINHHSELLIVLPQLNDEFKSQVIREYLALANKINDAYSRVKIYKVLAPHINYDSMVQIMSTIESMNAFNSTEAIVGMMPYMHENLKSKALSILQSSREKGEISLMYSSESILKIAAHLNAKLKSQMLKDELIAICNIRDASERAYGLCKSLPYLTDELRQQAVQKALTTTRKIKKANFHARRLVDLLPFLANDLKTQALRDALATTRKVKDTHTRINWLVDLLPFLADDLKTQALRDALTTTRKIKDVHTRIDGLVKLLPFLTDDLKTQALHEALTTTRKIKNVHARIDGLVKLLPFLTDDLKAQVFHEALIDARKNSAVYLLVKFLPHLDSEIQQQFTQEIFTATYEIKDKGDQAFALRPLFLYLTGEPLSQLIQNTLSITHEISHEEIRAGQLAFLLPYLTNKLILQELEIANKATSIKYRAEVLFSFVPFLDTELKIMTLRDILYITLRNPFGNEFSQPIDQWESALADWSKTLKAWQSVDYKDLQKNLIPFFRRISLRTRDRGFGIVRTFTPSLVHFRGPEIADELYRTITDVTRWWP